MKKITTYRVSSGEYDDDKVIERIAKVSDSGKILNRVIYSDGKIESEADFTYDEKDRLIEEKEKTNEGGLTVIKYTLDDEGNIINAKNFFGSELYQEEKFEFAEKTKTKLSLLDGELTEKVVETENEDGSETIEVFDGEGKLTQIQTTIETENTVQIMIYDENKVLKSGIIEVYDASDELVERKELDADKNLTRMDKFVVENGMIVEHHFKSKMENGGIMEFTTTYKYDEQENEIYKEVKNPSGDIMEVQEKKYNDKGELIEDIHENLSGNRSFGETYHKVNVIEELG